MVLVLFFIGIVIFFLLMLVTSIKINIKDLEITNMSNSKNKIFFNSEIRLYLFGKILCFKKSIDTLKINNSIIKNRLKKINIYSNTNIDIKTIKKIKKELPKFEKFHLYIKLGTEDVILTSFIVFLTSTILSISLPQLIEDNSIKNIKYKIEPQFSNKNIYSIKFQSIICLKMVNIINIIYIILQKRRESRDERASNSRTYANSYE